MRTATTSLIPRSSLISLVAVLTLVGNTSLSVNWSARATPTEDGYSEGNPGSPASYVAAQSQEDEVEDYLRRPPAERVKLYLEGKRLSQLRMRDGLVVYGIDAVPELVNLTRTGNHGQQMIAVSLLCDMDRFVSLSEIPVPEIGDSVYVKPDGISGRLNRFMKVDGRRIGAEGREAVEWAASQTRRSALRFVARECTGLLEADLRALTLPEQFKRWEETVKRTKGLLWTVDPQAYTESTILMALLVEQVPESISLLMGALENRSDFIRRGAILALATIDFNRMRLRKSGEGMKAIAAIERTLNRAPMKPFLKTRQDRRGYWEQLSAFMLRDELPINQGSKLATIALGMEKLHGARTTRRRYTGVDLIEAAPEMRDFVGYLTDIDPYFPSWEYSYTGDPRDEVLHLRFKAKIERYYEHWKKFNAEKRTK